MEPRIRRGRPANNPTTWTNHPGRRAFISTPRGQVAPQAPEAPVSNSANLAVSASAASTSAHVLSPVLRPAIYRRALHPLNGMLLGAANAFLVSGFLSDWAYASSTEIQWKNFAGWLI